MRNLIPGLLLRGAQIEEQFAIWRAARVIVRNGSAVCAAIDAVGHGIYDAGLVGKVGLEVKVQVSVVGRSDQDVVGECV